MRVASPPHLHAAKRCAIDRSLHATAKFFVMQANRNQPRKVSRYIFSSPGRYPPISVRCDPTRVAKFFLSKCLTEPVQEIISRQDAKRAKVTDLGQSSRATARDPRKISPFGRNDNSIFLGAFAPLRETSFFRFRSPTLDSKFQLYLAISPAAGTRVTGRAAGSRPAYRDRSCRGLG